VNRIHGAGVRSIEVTSFVSPKAAPQLADAAELVEAVRADALAGAFLSAFVAKHGGAERAVAAGVDELSTTVPATDGMTQANFRRDRDTMLQEVAAMRGDFGGVPMSVTVAVAFGCPFEGAVPASLVVEVSERLAEAGYERILLGDRSASGTRTR
jgi:hydroxymethylglutaryl-CoA lyase